MDEEFDRDVDNFEHNLKYCSLDEINNVENFLTEKNGCSEDDKKDNEHTNGAANGVKKSKAEENLTENGLNIFEKSKENLELNYIFLGNNHEGVDQTEKNTSKFFLSKSILKEY